MLLTQVAPQLNTQNISKLCLLNGEIYAGTQNGGRLFKWNGVDAWVQVAPQLNSQSYIHRLLVWNGEIYGGTYNGGRLFKWNGVDAWAQVAPSYSSTTTVWSLIVFNDTLYSWVSANTSSGNFLRWNNSNAWVLVLNRNPYIRPMLVKDNYIYGITTDSSSSTTANLCRWPGSGNWELLAGRPSNSESNMYGFCTFNDKIYGGGGGGRLFEWNGVDAWVLKLEPLQITPVDYNNPTGYNMGNIMELLVVGNYMYAVGAGIAGRYNVFCRWDGVSSDWECLAVVSQWENFNSLVNIGNVFYMGSNSSGKLFEYTPPVLPERSINKLFSFNNKMLLASDNLINDGLSGLRFDDNRNVLKMYNGLGSL